VSLVLLESSLHKTATCCTVDSVRNVVVVLFLFRSDKVKAGEDHLLTCQKAATCFPDVRTVIQRNKASKGEAKLPALLERQHEQSAVTSAAVPTYMFEVEAITDSATLSTSHLATCSLGAYRSKKSVLVQNAVSHN